MMKLDFGDDRNGAAGAALAAGGDAQTPFPIGAWRKAHDAKNTIAWKMSCTYRQARKASLAVGVCTYLGYNSLPLS